jgi:hypothetical protein
MQTRTWYKMKVIKFTLWCIVLLVSWRPVFGQALAVPQGTAGNLMQILDPNYMNSSLLYAKAAPNDNPFLVNDFLPADITLKDNKTIRGIPLKYDVESQLVVASDNGRLLVLDNKVIESFVLKLPGDKGLSTFIRINDGEKDIFFDLLAFSRVKLLKKITKSKQRRTEVNSTGYNDDGKRPSAFKQVESYYLLMDDGLHMVKLSRKSIIRALGNSKYEDCAQRLQLNLSELEDVKTLIRECN